MVLCYIFGRERRSCCVLLAFGRGVVKLLSYNMQSSRKLLPISRIIADKESLLALGDDKIGDIHKGLKFWLWFVGRYCGDISDLALTLDVISSCLVSYQ